MNIDRDLQLAQLLMLKVDMSNNHFFANRNGYMVVFHGQCRLKPLLRFVLACYLLITLNYFIHYIELEKTFTRQKGYDYINSTGNTVSNSEPCNGIYNFKAQRCVKFDDSPGADSEDTLASSASTTEENNKASSDFVSTKDLPCTQMVGWFHF